MKSLRNVLAGTSLGPEGEAAVGAALAVGRLSGALVHVAHAYAYPAAYGGWTYEPGWMGAELLEWYEADLQRTLESQVEVLRSPEDVRPELHLAMGPPHRVLERLAREIPADLTIVGAARPGRLNRLLGSTADRLLRASPGPVLAVRGEPKLPPQRILAAVDLSPASAEAYRGALGILAALAAPAAPSLTALFVLSPLEGYASMQFTAEQIERLAHEELHRFVEQAGDGDVEEVVASGEPREVILAEAERRQVDLIAIGTHGRGGFDRMILGSVAADIGRDAPCSVLVVPPAAARSAG